MIKRFKDIVCSEESWWINEELILECRNIPTPDSKKELGFQQLGIERCQVDN
jgi:hypothetical protein